MINSRLLLIRPTHNQFSLPTTRLLTPNLSLVLMLYRHDTPISSMITKNRVTNRPDSTEGVMFMKSWLGLDGAGAWVAVRVRPVVWALVK